MATTTSIEWTDRTWNPVRGCAVVSPGCVNCYAMKQAHRFSGDGRPYAGLTKQTKAGPQWTGTIRTVDDALLEPLSWRKPQRVFVNSMSDLFHEGVPDEFIDRVFAVMALTPRHTFQILTKRADRMRQYFSAPDLYQRRLRAAADIRDVRPELTSVGISDPVLHPPTWIWLGVSCEDQQRADERVPPLLQTPAAVRFVSAEPLLGPIRFQRAWWPTDIPARLDWVIVGGESGAGARPCAVEWIEEIVRQCRGSGVACFVKQLGAFVVSEHRTDEDGRWAWRAGSADRKGGDPSEWPEHLRVREWPTTEVGTAQRGGSR